ncbi:MAG: M23 family metallopeptidase [Dysgonamonadaceae bacterium]|jgi:murein DD-endopeptidase MepM/ murein hydrolase activator NlpD|nr:M23 family metallopeptidase [Dysgonamonadaceae bacterium]
MHKKRLRTQTFWNKIRFKYKLYILNENTLGEVFSMRISGLSASLTIGLFSLLLIALTSVIIINTPIRNYLPGYLDVEVRNNILSLALRADSLEQALKTQGIFTSRLALIMKGEMQIDSTFTIDTLYKSKVDTVGLNKSEHSEKFVRQYEEESRYYLSALPRAAFPDSRSFFYPPVKGKISTRFDEREKHYGIDIATDPKESILATLDGTVVYTGFDPNAGYVIQLQHPNGYMSIYKHNAMLLKNDGDIVRAGEAVAIAGNTGILSTGTHLHFELWEKGRAIDPENYIVF